MSRAEMFAAISDDDPARVAELAHQNVHHAASPDPDTGLTPLHHAAALGRTAALAELMRYVLTYLGPDREGHTVLGLALRGGHFDCVDLILPRMPELYPADRDAVIELIHGRSDRADVALALYQRNARLRAAGGTTPALGAAQRAGLDAVAGVILQRIEDQQVLVDACQAGDVELIGRLVKEKRVNLNEADAQGWPILARAIAAQAEASIECLLCLGAPMGVHLPDRRDLSCLAIDQGREIARFWLIQSNVHHAGGGLQAEVLKGLARPKPLGSHIDGLIRRLSDHHRTRLLAAAAWGGHRGLVDRLRRAGVRTHSCAAAALWADSALLDALLAAGAAVNATGQDQLPPMHLLSLAEHESAAVELSQRLAELGADTLYPHRVHGTAIAFAQRMQCGRLADSLARLQDVGKFRWQREARARGIQRIRFYYDKSDGVCFAPNNPDAPLEVGGDYDGAYPSGAAQGLAAIKSSGLFDRLTPSQRKLLIKLARGEDFGIDEALSVVSERQVEYRR